MCICSFYCKNSQGISSKPNDALNVGTFFTCSRVSYVKSFDEGYQFTLHSLLQPQIILCFRMHGRLLLPGLIPTHQPNFWICVTYLVTISLAQFVFLENCMKSSFSSKKNEQTFFNSFNKYKNYKVPEKACNCTSALELSQPCVYGSIL